MQVMEEFIEALTTNILCRRSDYPRRAGPWPNGVVQRTTQDTARRFGATRWASGPNLPLHRSRAPTTRPGRILSPPDRPSFV
ncbi:hypothetical protein C8Q77DRAFT_686489 [Trametes polyzona]|nr:hypothetical protein C8Q77DRAFT_686489 [Trametes polyzona]